MNENNEIIEEQEIKIRYDIPPPKRRRKYPLDELDKIHASFFIPCTEEQLRSERNKIASAARRYGRRHGMEFSTAIIEVSEEEPQTGVRVWRLK